jgi:hypothetical protein
VDRGGFGTLGSFDGTTGGEGGRLRKNPADEIFSNLLEPTSVFVVLYLG